MDPRDLTADVVRRARAAGADACDALYSEGTEFKATVRLGELETLKQAGGRGLGLRVFVGRRSAVAHSSDLTAAALAALAADAVAMARASSEDPHAGLPEAELLAGAAALEPEGLELHDGAAAELPAEQRIELARRTEAAALATSPEITNSQGATFESHDSLLALANSHGFVAGFRRSQVSLSMTPLAERDGAKERDYWYTSGRGLRDLDSPEEVGRIAAQRTLRRLGARQVRTCEVPVVFEPEITAQVLTDLFDALSGYSVFRNATFLKDRLGQQVASPFVTLVDDGRLRRGLGTRPFDGEGLATRRNVPLERGVLTGFLCDTYAARRIGARPAGVARRTVSGAPGVGPSNFYLEAGERSVEDIVGELERGLYVTDLMGFGVNVVSGEFSQGAAGLWIENGRLSYPVQEITIAGNLKEMLLDIDAVGNDLRLRASVSAPTVRVRRMVVSGS